MLKKLIGLFSFISLNAFADFATLETQTGTFAQGIFRFAQGVAIAVGVVVIIMIFTNHFKEAAQSNQPDLAKTLIKAGSVVAVITVGVVALQLWMQSFVSGSGSTISPFG